MTIKTLMADLYDQIADLFDTNRRFVWSTATIFSYATNYVSYVLIFFNIKLVNIVSWEVPRILI
jgi:hypothetical protein